ERTEAGLRSAARLVSDIIEGYVTAQRTAALRERVRQLGATVDCRITIIRLDGVVLADNEADPEHMDNHHDRPGIVGAAAQGDAYSLRRSDTLHLDLLYFAHRVNGPAPYYVRLAVPLESLDRQLHALYFGLGTAALLAIAGGGTLCYLLARRN